MNYASLVFKNIYLHWMNSVDIVQNMHGTDVSENVF